MSVPAEPVLAASMWTSNEADAVQNDGAHLQPMSRKLATQVSAIDDALDGGFRYGAVHCVIPDADQDSRDLIQAQLASHLRSSFKATATLVECTSMFDVRRLYQALDKAAKGENVQAQTTMQTLERLKIMKVFDHVGLTEAFSELQEALDTAPLVDTAIEPIMKPPKSTIPDSEDEEEEEEEEEDEMPDLSAAAQQPPKMVSTEEEDQCPRRLLVIDNISQLFAPLIKNNYTNGQASLASFMWSLNHLTRTHELCTVLVSHASNKPASKEESLSHFGSCTVQPALGMGFGSLVDMLIYLHGVPTKKTTSTEKQSRTRAMMSVLEVVHDRRGGSYGRWAPFLRDPDGSLKDVREAVPRQTHDFSHINDDRILGKAPL